MEFTVKDYTYLMGLIGERLNIKPVTENMYIHEFFEGPIPLFKLLFVERLEEGGTAMMVSFHLDVDSVDAIQWFLRIRNIYQPLMITQCYYKDDNGETFLGVTAEQLKLFKIQQAALVEWGSDKEAAKKMIDAKAIGRKRARGRDKGFIDIKEAEDEFFKMMPNKEKDEIQ